MNVITPTMPWPCIPSRNQSYAWENKNPSGADYAQCIPVPPGIGEFFTGQALFTGMVTNWTGDKKVPGVAVHISKKTGWVGAKEQDVVSDTTGYFIANLNINEEYIITAKKAGYKDATYTFMASKVDGKPSAIVIKMIPTSSNAEVVPQVPTGGSYAIQPSFLQQYGLPMMLGVVIIGGAVAYMLTMKSKSVAVQPQPVVGA